MKINLHLLPIERNGQRVFQQCAVSLGFCQAHTAAVYSDTSMITTRMVLGIDHLHRVSNTGGCLLDRTVLVDNPGMQQQRWSTRRP